ncbi:MAG: hypothetical protein E7021_03750 [Alphaproteobacteria bacterium]|nr:hypothetical protein [Alphaproteobacteria bacterium]
MLYLVFVLTFLCGILFYSLSPRDDHLKWDMHRAEGFIAGFLAQHQSAKDYIDMWLGVDYKNKADGITNFNLNKETDGDNFDFLLFAPVGTAIDIDKNAQGRAPNIQSNNGSGYIQTAVFCLDESDQLIDCNGGGGDVSDVYLASYSQVFKDGADNVFHRPTWWPSEESNRQRRFGSWRRSITHRTRGSYSCGVLTCTGWDVDNDCTRWCIDNGQRIYLPNGQCAMTVPTSIVERLNDTADLSDDKLNDILFCLTRLKKNPSEYYVAGLTALYDGINNQETGAEGERYSGEANFWPDLITIESAYTDVSGSEQHVTFAGDTPAVATDSSNGGVKFPNINIRDPFTNFTLTLLLKGYQEDANFNIDVLNLGNLKLRLKNDDGSYTVQILDSDGEVANRSLSLNPNEIISLTVIGSSDDLKVYVNGYDEAAFTVGDNAGYVSPAETPLAITHGTGGGLIYGVRYYSGKRLTTTPQERNGRLVPSELGKNFNVDSKRYGIGTQENPF